MRWFHSNTCLQRIEQRTQQAPRHGVLSLFPVDSKYLYKLTRKKICPNLHNLSISIYSHFGHYETVKHIYFLFRVTIFCFCVITSPIRIFSAISFRFWYILCCPKSSFRFFQNLMKNPG